MKGRLKELDHLETREVVVDLLLTHCKVWHDTSEPEERVDGFAYDR
jgi:hypothetical protein